MSGLRPRRTWSSEESCSWGVALWLSAVVLFAVSLPLGLLVQSHTSLTVTRRRPHPEAAEAFAHAYTDCPDTCPLLMGPVIGTSNRVMIEVRPGPAAVSVEFTEEASGKVVLKRNVAVTTGRPQVVQFHPTGQEAADRAVILVRFGGCGGCREGRFVAGKAAFDPSKRTAVVSCSHQDRPRTESLWLHLLQDIMEGTVDSVIHLGDQIYADDAVAVVPHHDARAVEEAYRGLYRRVWGGTGAVAAVLGRSMALMQADDHDVFDDFGDAHARGVTQDSIADVGLAMLNEYQIQLRLRQPRHDYYVSYQLGGGTLMVVLEVRAAKLKREGGFLDTEQWALLERDVQRYNEQKMKRLVVVSPLPPLLLPTWAATVLTPLHDDLYGSWSHRSHAAAQHRLLTLLRSAWNGNVQILAGDSHFAGVTRDQAAGVGLVQYMTSPIQNDPIKAWQWPGLVLLMGRRAAVSSFVNRCNYMTISLDGDAGAQPPTLVVESKGGRPYAEEVMFE